MLSDKKILFTGATGQVVRPVAEAMAVDNEVWCAARFSDPEIESELRERAIKTFKWTMGETDLDGLDTDFTHVVHAAPYRGQPDTDTASQANAVGAGMLMDHCRGAEAFLFVSTFAVYAKPPSPDHLIAETDPLGGYAPYAPSYPIGKMAAEGAVRAFARVLGLPTTIARLNVCYGPTGWGGLPVEFFKRIVAGEPIWVPSDGSEIWSSPISTDDILHFLPGLFEATSPAPTIVNLAGDESLRMREYVGWIAERAGLEVRFEPSEQSRESFASDNTRRKQLVGDCRVEWREGMARAIEAHMPGAFDGSAKLDVGPVEANIWGQR